MKTSIPPILAELRKSTSWRRSVGGRCRARSWPVTGFALACLVAVLAASGCAGPDLSGSETPDVATDSGSVRATDSGGGTKTDTTAGPEVAVAKKCTADSECPPAVAQCREAFCDEGTCDTRPTTGAQTCNDGNKCTESDLCANGKCSGKAVSCDDNNPCTGDVCLPKSGCQHANLVEACQKDDLCAVHACQSGKCTVINATPCDDGNPCTSDSCDTKIGCQYKVLTGPACDDGDSCTKGDVCKFGNCVGKGKSCNDGNPCTDDGCDPSGTCTNKPNEAKCQDGKPCTGPDVCAGAVCAGPAKVCSDDSPCSEDFCNGLTGQCDVKPAVGEIPCDDGNVCTVGDTCVGYMCSGGLAKNCDDGSPCTVDACDAASGACNHTPLEDGSVCGADNLCLMDGKCQQGACLGEQKMCDDANPCTQDFCDPASGVCTKADLPDGTPCGQGQTCLSGVCSAP